MPELGFERFVDTEGARPDLAEVRIWASATALLALKLFFNEKAETPL